MITTKEMKSTDVHTEDIKAPQKSKAVKKGKKKVNKKGAGRHTKMTPEVLEKLKAAFSNDMTDEEACWYAEIDPKTMYTYQKQHPEFLQSKLRLKARPVMKAREEFVKKLSSRKVTVLDKNGQQVEITIAPDSKDLKWYLEKKRKDEFGKELKVTHEGGVEVKGALEMAKVLQAILEEGDEHNTKENKSGQSDNS